MPSNPSKCPVSLSWTQCRDAPSHAKSPPFTVEAKNADGASVTIDAMPLALVRVRPLGLGLEP
jgi:hypothetical protein